MRKAHFVEVAMKVPPYLHACYLPVSLDLLGLAIGIGATKKGTRGGPGPPPIRSKIGKIRSKMEAKSFKMGPFWGMVILENTCCKTKFKS